MQVLSILVTRSAMADWCQGCIIILSSQQRRLQERTARQLYHCSKLYTFIDFRMLDQEVPHPCPKMPNRRSYFAPSAVVTQATDKATCVPGERSMKTRHHGKSLMIICHGIEERPRDSCPSALGSGPCSDGKHWKIRGKRILL